MKNARQVVRLSEDRRGHVDKDPQVTADGSGRLWVAWHSYRYNTDRILIRALKGDADLASVLCWGLNQR